MDKKQNVMIKGTKDGLLLTLDDQCAFSELLSDLTKKLNPHLKKKDKNHAIYVTIHTGNRLLTEKQKKQVLEILSQTKNLKVQSIESNVISIEEAERQKKETEVQRICKIVRSGQILEIKGDALLIGDVNPGGVIKATGNIFVVGSLKGVAHAGCNGNEDAVICASRMNPTQLRIADIYSRAPDREEGKAFEPECAYINSSKEILIDRIVVLKNIRPNLNRFVEGGF